MPRKTPFEIILTSEEREHFTSLARKYTAPHKVYALMQKKDIPFQNNVEGWIAFTLPKLELYEVIVI